jgi:hypothetical protein
VLRSWEKFYKADLPFILLASILTMMRVPWTDEETAALIIFDMWGFKTEAIAEILTNRRAEIRAIVGSIPQYKRTSSAVSNKLTQLRNQNHNLWLSDRGWDRDAVTEFLYRSTLDHDFGRVVMCGLISQYNAAPYPITNIHHVLAKRVTMCGFTVSDANMGPVYSKEH